MFKKPSLPLQLLFVIVASLVLGNFLSESVIRGCYTFSLVFKEILGFFLPFIIFTFIISGILSFKKNAHIVLFVMITCIIASNFLVSMTSFTIGKTLLGWLYNHAQAQKLVVADGLKPFFTPHFPALIASEK
ncbi:hypothetical protein KAT92_03430, partial [Candidatus Babeliales bacterium]|nr:hypothetical protein [Candidatus Babeliales bacterium]